MQDRGPATGRWALLWCLLALPLCDSARTIFIREGDGPAFAQAVAAFGGDGVDTTIYLPPGRILSVANVNFSDAVPVNPSYVPFSSGILTIMPAPSNDSSAGPTILDAAMRYGLPSFGGRPMLFTNTAEIHLINITIVNMCDLFLTADIRNNIGWNMAFGINLFPRNRARQSHFTTNVTLHVRQAEIGAMLLYSLGFKSTIPAYQAQANRVLVDTPRNPTLYAPRDLTTHALFTPLTIMPAEVMIAKMYRSTSDPNDPLLNSLRAAGLIMPHQLCAIPNATVQVPPVSLFDPRAPVAVVSDTQAMLQAMRNAVELNRVNGSINGLPPVIMLVSAATPATLAGHNPLPPLVGPLLLTGMLSDVPGVYDWAGIIDFQYQSTPMLPVSQTGTLMLQKLVLQGLPTALLPGSGTPSALPLSAFPRAQGSDLIAFDSVTLVLPGLDYLALLSLVQPAARCSWNATVQRHAAALAAGISTLGGPRVSPGYGSISLSAFTGWGLNGTNLKILPDNRDLPAAVAVACGFADGAGLVVGVSATDHKPSAQDAGVIVGCVTAGVLLGAALTMLAMFIYMKCRSPPLGKQTDASPTASAHGSQASGSTAPSAIDHAEKGGDDGNRHNSAQHPLPLHAGSNDLHANSASSDGNTDMYTTAHSGPNSNRARQALASAAFQGPLLCTSVPSAAQVAVPQGRALQPSDVQALVSFCGDVAVVPVEHSDKLLVCLPTRHSSGDGAASGATEPDSPYLSLPPAAQQPEAAEHSTGLVRHAASAQAVLQRADFAAQQHDQPLPTDPTQAIKLLLEAMPSDSSTVEVLCKLGQGAWGTVYHALWRGLHVALKTMVFEVMVKHDNGNRISSKEQRRHEQALLETAVAASVNHPNVVRTYYYEIKSVGSPKPEASSGLQIEDITRAQTGRLQAYKLFLIQELCTMSLAQTLDDGILHENGRIREPLVVFHVLLDIARGLEYLHSRKIVHGDLKPENVLIKPHDGPAGIVCKLADFGLSARLPGNATHVSYFSKGTPFYVAPEVVLEHRTSPASDVFSFGVMMWQLYTGCSPYDSGPEHQLIWNPSFPKFHADAVPPPVFSHLMCRCFLREPKERPTAAQIVTAIDNLIIAVTASQSWPTTSMGSSCPAHSSNTGTAPANVHAAHSASTGVQGRQGKSTNLPHSLYHTAASQSEVVMSL